MLSAGAVLTKNTVGFTPKDCALRARRFDIVSVLDNFNTTYDNDCVRINGNEVSGEKLKNYKEILRNSLQSNRNADSPTESKSNTSKENLKIFRSLSKGSSKGFIPPLVDVQEQYRRNKLLLSIVEINRNLIKGYAKNCSNTWLGFIRFPEEQSINGSWKNYYCCIDHSQILLYKSSKDHTPVDSLTYENILSFRVYLDIPSRFSVLFQGTTEIKNLAAKPEQVFSILKGLFV